MIYIVEDDASIRELEQYALQTNGYEAAGCEDAASFWAAMHQARPELVILDVMLPDEDGYQILSKLRDDPATQTLPVIMVTAKTSEIDVVKGLDHGADDYLCKPFGIMEFISRVKAVLRRAAVRKCDLFIAVNHEENANIVSATLAKRLGAKKSIARIDNNEYLEPDNKEMFIDMGIDYLFYPEKVAAREVINLLGHTSTTEYVDFSSGKLSLVVFRLEPASPLVGEVLTGFDDDQAPLSYRTVAITRGGQTIIPREGEQFMEGDVIYVIARQDAVREVMEFSGQSNIEIKNMMILGGSRIGIRIATELQDEVNIKLIDYNAEKAYRLAETLDKTLIINEDGRNTEAMMEEGLSNMDAFVAVTGRSETNILAAMLAKRMGVKKVIAEVENLNYINLAESIGIDTIINKKLVTASNIFRFTMSTDVQAIKCLTGSLSLIHI